MPNPTRAQILNAHEALAELRALVESNPPRHDTHAEKLESRIFAALPPLPQPTMAEVEWDDDKHYLAEAETQGYGPVVMLRKSSETGNIELVFKNQRGIHLTYADPEDLAPTGKRYTLTEVQE